MKRNPKRPTARHIIIKVAKFQVKEKILKAARGKKGSNIQGRPDKVSNRLLNRNTPSQKGIARNLLSIENQRPVTKTTLFSRALN